MRDWNTLWLQLGDKLDKRDSIRVQTYEKAAAVTQGNRGLDDGAEHPAVGTEEQACKICREEGSR